MQVSRGRRNEGLGEDFLDDICPTLPGDRTELPRIAAAYSRVSTTRPGKQSSKTMNQRKKPVPQAQLGGEHIIIVRHGGHDTQPGGRTQRIRTRFPNEEAI
ncbi:hypothetical protein LTS18_014351 [Coniosporium uncinatum]|uniref:Uncharacterized protein n=1 Tax=Coniosporium uncinatum TaxID=93489 RepID=A0ACC3CW27_9PEZI|nr:hypothetical protein LTS18_014351 [Coniosporium uncinatum]